MTLIAIEAHVKVKYIRIFRAFNERSLFYYFPEWSLVVRVQCELIQRFPKLNFLVDSRGGFYTTTLT